LNQELLPVSRDKSRILGKHGAKEPYCRSCCNLSLWER